jgi:hypothetical protein
MTTNDYSTSYAVDQSSEEVFNAIKATPTTRKAEQNPDHREMVGASIVKLKKSPLAPMSFRRRPGLTHE